MKMTFGRKFFACLFGVAVLMLLFFVTLYQNPEAITAPVVITYGALACTVVAWYIGGNVLKGWIRSKWFQADIFNSEKQ